MLTHFLHVQGFSVRPENFGDCFSRAVAFLFSRVGAIGCCRGRHADVCGKLRTVDTRQNQRRSQSNKRSVHSGTQARTALPCLGRAIVMMSRTQANLVGPSTGDLANIFTSILANEMLLRVDLSRIVTALQILCVWCSKHWTRCCQRACAVGSRRVAIQVSNVSGEIVAAVVMPASDPVVRLQDAIEEQAGIKRRHQKLFVSCNGADVPNLVSLQTSDLQPVGLTVLRVPKEQGGQDIDRRPWALPNTRMVALAISAAGLGCHALAGLRQIDPEIRAGHRRITAGLLLGTELHRLGSRLLVGRGRCERFTINKRGGHNCSRLSGGQSCEWCACASLFERARNRRDTPSSIHSVLQRTRRQLRSK